MLYEALGEAVRAERPVIFSVRGNGMSAGGIKLWFYRLYSSLGMEGCSSHSGRRKKLLLTGGFLAPMARGIAYAAETATNPIQGRIRLTIRISSRSQIVKTSFLLLIGRSAITLQGVVLKWLDCKELFLPLEDKIRTKTSRM
ncbi:MAG: hypothetical protein ETSY1_40905 [Candidatus Entotheonella factor]|uniref:Uncharacterized protein n=1 Tax=Entotheonella factor TaxID=1429438 RepID=W4L4R9_ENTF1|nr:MAG: hypothetical protein ETSY1_40905 [Candidatus Entotheonella factor]